MLLVIKYFSRKGFPLAPRYLVARIVFLALLASPLFSPTPADAWEALRGTPASPLARILYTADTLGALHPCVTCGGASQGGLARRAALLPQLASEQNNPLVLAGPNEFYSDKEAPVPDKTQKLTAILHAAFSSMPYTAIYLSPRTATAMEQAGLALPANAVPVDGRPVTNFYRAGSLTVGCVFLPAASGAERLPSQEQIQAARLAAREAAASADLIVAVSPWGIQAENSLAASFAGDVHILLGSGEGIAVPGQATGSYASPGPLWVRSDRRGRAVSVLDIYALPARGTPWLDGIHFSARLAFLDPALPEDASILKIIGDTKDSD